MSDGYIFQNWVFTSIGLAKHLLKMFNNVIEFQHGNLPNVPYTDVKQTKYAVLHCNYVIQFFPYWNNVIEFHYGSLPNVVYTNVEQTE